MKVLLNLKEDLSITKVKKYIYFLILIVCISCQTPQKQQPEESIADEPINEYTPVFSDGVEISYETSGVGDTTVVLVHGWCINKTYWKDQITELSKNYHVVAIDNGGHGASGKNRESWKITDFASDVMAVINTLNLKQVILVGHSMGGNIILEVANQMPERIIGFIGIDNFKEIGAEIDMAEVEGFFSVMESDFENTVEGYSRAALFHPKSDSVAVERVVADFRSSDPKIAVTSIRGLFEHAQTEVAQIQALQIPINLIVGDATPMNEEALKTYAPEGSQVVYMEEVGHYPMIEKSELFSQLLEDTIERILKSE